MCCSTARDARGRASTWQRLRVVPQSHLRDVLADSAAHQGGLREERDALRAFRSASGCFDHHVWPQMPQRSSARPLGQVRPVAVMSATKSRSIRKTRAHSGQAGAGPWLVVRGLRALARRPLLAPALPRVLIPPGPGRRSRSSFLIGIEVVCRHSRSDAHPSPRAVLLEVRRGLVRPISLASRGGGARCPAMWPAGDTLLARQRRFHLLEGVDIFL
jgi:hypothetical protein